MISSCFVCAPIDTSLLEVGEGEYILQYDRLANGWDFPPGIPTLAAKIVLPIKVAG